MNGKYLAKPRLSLVATALLAISIAPSAFSQTVTIAPNTAYQTIRGFGGHNGPGWIPDLTADQVDTAFGTGPGQIGLSIMRMRIDSSSAMWNKQLPMAQLAKAKGVTLFATPWSPPAYMKTNNNLIRGSLLPAFYADYATHLLNFASYMQSNGATLYGISVQNEPNWEVSYEGCLWTPSELINFLTSQGPRFGSLKVMAPETSNFGKAFSDPILNDANAEPQFDILAGHLYGVTPSDYPLARAKGKELWMTEHYTDSVADANDWLKALPVAVEVHKSMFSNYSAYVWWYIRRSYGLISENGQVSKRGHIMSQYAKYVRPGSTRIEATERPYHDLLVTAYKDSSGKIVVVAVNNGSTLRRVDFNFGTGTTSTLAKYSTSATANGEYGGDYAVSNGTASAYVEPLSVATFVKQAAAVDLTGTVKITQSGLTTNRFTGQVSGTVFLTNSTSVPITGALQLSVEGLSPLVTLDSRSGERNGVPFISLQAATIAPGATVSVATTFSNPSKVSIGYTPKLYNITY
jgi:glucuronoarabinoxylan endo-1,4-beta-xylanase